MGIINSLQNKMRTIQIFDCVLFPEYVEQNKICNLIMDCPGVGPALAVAVSIAINDDYFRFKNARDFAAFFGVIPSHSGTGGKNRNGRMTPVRRCTSSCNSGDESRDDEKTGRNR